MINICILSISVTENFNRLSTALTNNLLYKILPSYLSLHLASNLHLLA